MRKQSNRSIEKLSLIAFLILGINISGCAPAVYSSKTLGTARFVRVSDNNNILHLETQGTGASKNKRRFDACSNALKAVLLQGISGSSVAEFAMASPENFNLAERELEKLMNSGNYLRFINYISEKDAQGKIPNPNTKGYTSQKQITYVIGINYTDLRRHFESIGAIRKFGL